MVDQCMREIPLKRELTVPGDQDGDDETVDLPCTGKNTSKCKTADAQQ